VPRVSHRDAAQGLDAFGDGVELFVRVLGDGKLLDGPELLDHFALLVQPGLAAVRGWQVGGHGPPPVVPCCAYLGDARCPVGGCLDR
jgi:hypothetical protein